MTSVQESSQTEVNELGIKLAGKYLTFLLENEEYAVEILKVQEIIQMQKVTPVPGSPEFIRGVINLRGRVIPIVELRTKFNMAKKNDTEKTAIVVMMIENSSGNSMTMGIIIDEVKEVKDVDAGSIEKTPALGSSIDTGFIMGICKDEGTVKMLLDINKVLSNEEFQAASSIA